MKTVFNVHRMLALLLSLCMLLVATAMPIAAGEASSPVLPFVPSTPPTTPPTSTGYGMRLELQLSEDQSSLKVSLQMMGAALCYTQFLALAYDASLLTLDGAEDADAPQPMTNTAPFAFYDGWHFGDKQPHACVKETAGYLYLYPTHEAAVTYDAYQTAMSVTFTVKNARRLGESSIRLISDAEETLFSQSYKVAMSAADKYMTFGADAGDMLPEVAFGGNTPITGVRTESMVGTFALPWVNPFSDVKNDAPYFDAIAYVCQNDLFQGSSATTFDPEFSMIRATFATVLCRLAGAEEEAKADVKAQAEFLVKFSDVKNTWYVPYLAWGVKTGLFLGNDKGEIMPNDNISIEQMYLLMMRFFDLYGYETEPYDQAEITTLADGKDIHTWAADGVAFAMANGLLLEDANGNARPRADAKRFELATVLMRMGRMETVVTGK